MGNKEQGRARTGGDVEEERVGGCKQLKPVVFEVRMKKWKEKRTMGPKNIKWWKGKDEMMVEYRERVRRKYEELDAEKKKQWRVNGVSTRMHSFGWRRSCVAERRGKVVHREAEIKDGGRKRWRRQWERSGKHGR